MKNYSSQSGAVLIVSLVMLLVITVVGISSMGITTVDTKITANFRDRQMALTAAESGLYQAEAAVNPEFDLPVVGTTVGYLSQSVSTALADDWWAEKDDSWWSSVGAEVSDYKGQKEPTYLINQPDIKQVDEGNKVKDLSLGEQKPAMFYYPLTAKGEGPGGTQVYLQSVYARKVYSNPN